MCVYVCVCVHVLIRRASFTFLSMSCGSIGTFSSTYRQQNTKYMYVYTRITKCVSATSVNTQYTQSVHIARLDPSVSLQNYAFKQQLQWMH